MKNFHQINLFASNLKFFDHLLLHLILRQTAYASTRRQYFDNRRLPIHEQQLLDLLGLIEINQKN